MLCDHVHPRLSNFVSGKVVIMAIVGLLNR
jgi:hypothetical protein